MKICKYCGRENADEATACISCGAGEFKHKCENCGTVFETGNFCPNCGTKAGKQAKKCPRCGAEYFSVACPECGYTLDTGNRGQEAVAPETSPNTEKPEKKKKWPWVLGWIFAFPIPLTILMLRNQKLNKRLKIGIIAAGWLAYVILLIVGSKSGKSTQIEQQHDSKISEEISSIEKTEEKTPEEAQKEIEEQAKELEAAIAEQADAISEAAKKVGAEIASETKGAGKVIGDIAGALMGGDYEDIYDEYSEKIRNKTPELIEEYNEESKTNTAGLEGLAMICDEKVGALAEISTEGIQKMAEYMMLHGSGSEGEYEEWAGKLYEVYDEEAKKIMEVYLTSATG